AGDDHPRALEEIPAVEASPFAPFGFFVSHGYSSLKLLPGQGIPVSAVRLPEGRAADRAK
ncbi:MAG: hypothetical protein JXP48_04145, partial [Acidobacteria bacterium]|nr:hypothetical protein [Acidobacteriota bacterium]